MDTGKAKKKKEEEEESSSEEDSSEEEEEEKPSKNKKQKAKGDLYYMCFIQHTTVVYCYPASCKLHMIFLCLNVAD